LTIGAVSEIPALDFSVNNQRLSFTLLMKDFPTITFFFSIAPYEQEIQQAPQAVHKSRINFGYCPSTQKLHYFCKFLHINHISCISFYSILEILGILVQDFLAFDLRLNSHSNTQHHNRIKQLFYSASFFNARRTAKVDFPTPPLTPVDEIICITSPFHNFII